MKWNNLPNYPRITLEELSKLKLDNDSSRRFERRFAKAMLGGVGFAFVGFAGSFWLHKALAAWLPNLSAVNDAVLAFSIIGSFVLGGALFIWTHHRMMRARPISLQSGREMTPFIIQDLEAPDYYEIAYVDQSSGTYVRRLYVEGGGRRIRKS